MIINESFLTINPFSRCNKKLTSVKILIIHYTNNPGQTAQGCLNYFESLKSQLQVVNSRYASAHYIVGLNGEVIQAIPENEVAFHSGSNTNDPISKKIYTDKKRELLGENAPNYNSIGIEVCHPDTTGKYNSESIGALNLLAHDIILRYKLTRNQVVRHYDIVGWKKCPKYYVENQNEWDSLLDDIFKLV
jgi:N-acetylmuramoyl-L-alanine amidase